MLKNPRIVLLAFLTFSVPLSAEDVFIDIVHLGSAQTEVDKKQARVKTLKMIGERADYVLACNDGDSTCRTPEVEAYYSLVSNSNFSVYKCEQVGLANRGPDAHGYRGIYCLLNTYPHKQQ